MFEGLAKSTLLCFIIVINLSVVFSQGCKVYFCALFSCFSVLFAIMGGGGGKGGGACDCCTTWTFVSTYRFNTSSKLNVLSSKFY